MRSTVLYHYYSPERRNGLFKSFTYKHFALTSAAYTLNVSLLVILLYAWQINVNTKKQQVLGDVYYGVQIAYYAIIGSQLSILALSVVLMIGINNENIGLVIPWMLGVLTFMSLEAVATVYANILRDHINGHFDGLCKAEALFFMCRVVLNTLALYAVMRFYHIVRSGVSFKINETFIEL